MVKSVEKAIDEVVNGKKQSLQLIFTEGGSKHYKEVIGWSLNGNWVTVMLPDGSTEVFKAADVDFARHFNQE